MLRIRMKNVRLCGCRGRLGNGSIGNGEVRGSSIARVHPAHTGDCPYETARAGKGAAVLRRSHEGCACRQGAVPAVSPTMVSMYLFQVTVFIHHVLCIV